MSSHNLASKTSIAALQKTGIELLGWNPWSWNPWSPVDSGAGRSPPGRWYTNCSQSLQLCELVTHGSPEPASRSRGEPGSSVEVSVTKFQPEPGQWSLSCYITAKTILARFRSPSVHKLVCFGVLVRFFCCFLFFNDASILHILAEGFSSKK